MPSPITVFTFDGTASEGAWFTGDLAQDEGGAYPQKLACRLVNADPATWRWSAIDYHPEWFLFGEPSDTANAVAGVSGLVGAAVKILEGSPVPTLYRNFSRAYSLFKSALLALPPGSPFVLSGLSQGTMPVRLIYGELMEGELVSRRDDLVAIVNFGDACRPQGRTLGLNADGSSVPGLIDPGGFGAQKLPMKLQNGFTSSGLITPHPVTGVIPSYYWSFCNLDDSASTITDNSAGVKMQKIARAIYLGTPAASQNGAVPQQFCRLFDGLLGDFIDWLDLDLISAITSAIFLGATNNSIWGYGLELFRNDNPFDFLDDTIEFFQMVAKWLPFVAGFAGLGDVVANPHARYNDPYPYTAITGNTKSAVTLGFEYLYDLGLRYTNSSQWSTSLRV